MKDEYFVGVYKKADSRGEPANKTKWNENIYDDLLVTKDIDEANEFALKYNAKGYYVMFEWKSVEGYGSGDDYYEDEDYDYYIYKPYEMSDVSDEVALDDEDIDESFDKLIIREGIDRNDEAYEDYTEEDFEIADALLNCGFEESGFTTMGIEYVKGYDFGDDTGIYCVVELPVRYGGVPHLRQYDDDAYYDVDNTSGIKEFNNEHDVYQFCGWFAREYDFE